MKAMRAIKNEWFAWLIRDELLLRYPDAAGDLPEGWRALARETAGYYERGEDVPVSHRAKASAASYFGASASASAARAARAAAYLDVIFAAAYAAEAAKAAKAAKAASFAAAYLRMAEALVRIADLAPVDGLDARILSALEDGGKLKMRVYHSCATTHSRAGWAMTLHPRGAELEKALGPRLTATAIYLASTGEIPDFLASNESALASIREGAGL